MTERGRRQIERSAQRLAIGPSAVAATAEGLVIDIDEWTVPFPRRLKGRITVRTGPVSDATFSLHSNRRHQWRPIAPSASVEVAFEKPGIGWSGTGYLDMNTGSEPLEAGFTRWNWSREDEAGRTRIHYDVTERGGGRGSLALDCGADGSMTEFEPSSLHALKRTGWRVARSARAACGAAPRVERTLEDTPFYSRSMLAFDRGATQSRAIHETVDLDRFRTSWCQWMLPFKMPRWTR